MRTTLAHLFTPHHTNNHRPRILHPAGLVLCMALVLIVNSSVELLKVTQPDGLVLGFSSSITVDQVLEQTNQQRVEQGLAPLQLNPTLSQAAAAKAQDMFTHNYWAHISPSGIPPWTFIKNAGYQYSVAGENLARDFSETPTMVKAWMDSPTHKENIIHPKYVETGIAVANGKLDGVETTLVVHMFGSPARVAAAPQVQAGQTDTPASAPGSVPDAAPLPVQTQLETSPVEIQTQPDVIITTGEVESNMPVISPLDIKRSFILAVMVLILAVLVIDEVIIRNTKIIRFVGKNAAHIGFLSVILLLIMTLMKPGGIL